MDLSELEKLSDEEKKEAFDVALNIAKENNLSFEEAHKTVLQRIIDNKKSLESQPIKVEIPDVYEIEATNEPVVETTNGPVVEEYETRSNQEIRDMIVQESDELSQQCYEIIERNHNGLTAYPFKNAASSGAINSPEFFKKYDYNLSNSLERNGLTETFIKLNEKAREMNYFDYLSMDSEELEQERMREINNYEKRLNYYKNNEGQWDIKPDAATITLDHLISNPSGYGRSIGIVGNNYDDLYEYTSRVIGSMYKGNHFSERLYNETIELMAQTKEKLENMSPEEFRNYKIGLMKLSPEELEMFNSDINSKKYIEENHKTL